MTEWGWNEGYFWSKAKPLIQKSPSFHHHLVILSQNPMHHMVIPFIWGSFLILISFWGNTKRWCLPDPWIAEWVGNEQNDLWMTESGADTLKDTRPDSFIQRSFSTFQYLSIHLGTFSYSILIPVGALQHIWIYFLWASYHSYIILSFHAHFNNILSFRSHPIIPVHSFNIQVILILFHHSIVILSFLTHSIYRIPHHSKPFLTF